MSKKRTITTEAQLREAAKRILEQDEVLHWRWKAFEPRREVDALLELSLDRRKLVFEVEFKLTPSSRTVEWLGGREGGKPKLLVAVYPEADRLAFTQWFAANLRHPYTTPPVVSAYVPLFPEEKVERELGARPVADGGTLWLAIPADTGVFRENQRVGEFTLVCDVQIYLDLLQVGLRGPDQAKALREWEGFGRPAA
ncbi:MAG: hypothetical protein ABSH34_02410 [Verrucomicrobiota bacterium]